MGEWFTTFNIAAVIAVGIAIYCLIDAFKWQREGMPSLYKFFLLDGQLPITLYTPATVAANLSVGNFIVFVAIWGYRYGLVGLMWFIVNLALNVAGFVIFFRRFRGYVQSHENNGSIHDYLSRIYTHAPWSIQAKAIRLSAATVTIVCLTLAIVFEISLAVKLLSPSDPLQEIRYFAGLVFLIGLFTAYGGFRTLVVSDRVNAIVLFLATLFLCLIMAYLWVSAPNAPSISAALSGGNFEELSRPKILSITLIGFGWMLVSMDQWQRTCASRDYSVARRGLYIYFFIVMGFAAAFALWGVFDRSVLPAIVDQSKVKLSGDRNPLLDILSLESHVPFVVPLIAAGLVFAAVSTTNTFLTVCGSSFTTDIVVGTCGAHRPIRRIRGISGEFQVGIARTIIVAMVLIILLCFVGFAIHSLLSDPLRFFFIAYSVQFALLPSVMMSALPAGLRPSSIVVLISLYFGFAASLILGFGAWSWSQTRTDPILSLAPSDWLPMAPVATVVIGFIPLLLDTLGRLAISAFRHKGLIRLFGRWLRLLESRLRKRS